MPDQWSRGRLVSVLSCPACGASPRVSAEFVRRDDSLALPDIWHIVRCSECRSIYLSPRPDSVSLPCAYEDYYTHQAEDDALANGATHGFVAALVNGYLNWRFHMQREPAIKAGAWLFSCLPPLAMKLNVYLRHLPRSYCRPGTRLLDVGCGNGAFLLRARGIGISVQGCEPDPLAVETCKTEGLDVIQGNAFANELDHSRFDVITLNHVIEHVEHPMLLLQRLNSLLAPHGMLWIALPNPNALGVRLFGSGWNGLHPPFHLLIPSQSVLRAWLRDAGFCGVRFIRRGMQSPGLWRESIRIARQESVARSNLRVMFVRRTGDLLSSLTPRWGEETIIIARRAEAADVH